MNKKGLDAVVTTLIIILLVLVAVGIIWVVARNVVQQNLNPNQEEQNFCHSLNGYYREDGLSSYNHCFIKTGNNPYYEDFKIDKIDGNYILLK